MQSYVFSDAEPLSHVQRCVKRTASASGLVLVASCRQGWVDFMLLGVLGQYQALGCSVVAEHADDDLYAYPHLAGGPETERAVHAFGAIRDVETLQRAIERAEERPVVAAMHVTHPDQVLRRGADMLEGNPGAFDAFERVLRCVIAHA